MPVAGIFVQDFFNLVFKVPVLGRLFGPVVETGDGYALLSSQIGFS